jgi:hypothetical protein
MAAGTPRTGSGQTDTEMNSKFYTSFVIDTQDSELERQFTGVVELRGHGDDPPSADEIGRLLARKLNLEAERVRVLTWSRLH